MGVLYRAAIRGAVKWAALVRELGFFTAWLYVVDRILRRLHPACGLHFYRFMAQPLRAQPRAPSARGRAFAFRVVQSPEPVLAGLARPQAVIEQRFSQGARCLVATRDQALAGCIWFVRDRYAEDEVRVDYILPANGCCVWDFDVYVAESLRLGVLFTKLWDTFDAVMLPDGVRYCVSRINAFNQRSMGSHQSMGATACGWAIFLHVGAAQWMVSGQHPYIALGGRPRLLIAPPATSVP